MDDQNTEATINEPSFKDRHNFLLFIVASIVIALVVVIISMTMYNGSGAAQLDLSRPGYVSVRSRVDTSDSDFQTYPSNGAINKSVINDFQSLYNKQAQKVKDVDAFGGDPLSPDTLGISDSSTLQ